MKLTLFTLFFFLGHVSCSPRQTTPDNRTKAKTKQTETSDGSRINPDKDGDKPQTNSPDRINRGMPIYPESVALRIQIDNGESSHIETVSQISPGASEETASVSAAMNPKYQSILFHTVWTLGEDKIRVHHLRNGFSELENPTGASYTVQLNSAQQLQLDEKLSVIEWCTPIQKGASPDIAMMPNILVIDKNQSKHKLGGGTGYNTGAFCDEKETMLRDTLKPLLQVLVREKLSSELEVHEKISMIVAPINDPKSGSEEISATVYQYDAPEVPILLRKHNMQVEVTSRTYVAHVEISASSNHVLFAHKWEARRYSNRIEISYGVGNINDFPCLSNGQNVRNNVLIFVSTQIEGSPLLPVRLVEEEAGIDCNSM